MGQDIITGDLRVNGNISCGSLTPPAGCITDAAIQQSTGIQASKVIHQHVTAVELFGPAVTIAALTKDIYIAYGPGTILGFKGIIEVQATGGDRTVTVDLQKSTAGGAYATVLTATINITNATVIRTIVASTINTTAYVAGDLFRAVVTVAGAAGAQATGLLVALTTTESPS